MSDAKAQAIISPTESANSTVEAEIKSSLNDSSSTEDKPNVQIESLMDQALKGLGDSESKITPAATSSKEGDEADASGWISSKVEAISPNKENEGVVTKKDESEIRAESPVSKVAFDSSQDEKKRDIQTASTKGEEESNEKHTDEISSVNTKSTNEIRNTEEKDITDNASTEIGSSAILKATETTDSSEIVQKKDLVEVKEEVIPLRPEEVKLPLSTKGENTSSGTNTSLVASQDDKTSECDKEKVQLNSTEADSTKREHSAESLEKAEHKQLSATDSIGTTPEKDVDLDGKELANGKAEPEEETQKKSQPPSETQSEIKEEDVTAKEEEKPAATLKTKEIINEKPESEAAPSSSSNSQKAATDSRDPRNVDTEEEKAKAVQETFKAMVTEGNIDPDLIRPKPTRVDSMKAATTAHVDSELGLTEEEALAILKEEEDAKKEANSGAPHIQVYGSSVSGNRKIKKAQDKMLNYLEQYNIEFEFVDLAADEEARLYIKRKNPDSTAIPQLYINGEFKMEFEEFEELVEYDEVFEALGVDPDDY